jgi:hypothetical protein
MSLLLLLWLFFYPNGSTQLMILDINQTIPGQMMIAAINAISAIADFDSASLTGTLCWYT